MSETTTMPDRNLPGFDDPKVTLLMEMFRSKNWNPPDEFKSLPNTEINCLLLTTLLKLQDENRNCKNNNCNCEDFLTFSMHVKEYLYPFNSATY
jgi:hypothetical protein